MSLPQGGLFFFSLLLGFQTPIPSGGVGGGSSFHREQTVKLGIYLVGYRFKVVGIFTELAIISVDDNQMPFVVFYPFLIAVVQSFQIV